MKTESLLSQKYPRNPVLRLTLKSSMCIDYFWLRNCLQKLGPGTQKSSKKPSSTANDDIFCAHTLLLPQKPLMKTESLLSQKYPRHLVLRLTLKSSMSIDYCCLRNRWWKLSHSCPKNHPRNPVLRLTLKSSMCIDYCRLRNRLPKLGPWDAKIVEEAQFYGWRWHLLRT